MRLCWCPSRPVAKDEPPTLVKNGPKTGEGGKNDEGFDFVKTSANNLELACVAILEPLYNCGTIVVNWTYGLLAPTKNFHCARHKRDFIQVEDVVFCLHLLKLNGDVPVCMHTPAVEDGGMETCPPVKLA